MREIYINDIIECTKGKLIIGNLNTPCINFNKDTRTIKDGDIYIGLKGESFDGSLFWKDALNSGASCVIVQGINFTNEDLSLFVDKSIILVDDTLESLINIAKFKRNLYNIPVIAITGSVGKTSTKDIIYSVVSQKYKTLKTEGNYNNNIGLPLTILNLRNHEALVLEMGMNHLNEITLLSNIALPTISVITNIGTAHIGNLGSRENILKAKLEILEGMSKPILVINNDDNLLYNWHNNINNTAEVHTYGIENVSDIMANNIVLNEDNSTFTCISSDKEFNIQVPVGGKHFIYNALCACSIGKLLNETDEEIQKGIYSFELTKKRMDIQKLDFNNILINDSYNASYESMVASLNYLSSLQQTRKIAVLGDMLELGDFSKELHEKVGAEVVNNKIDILICSGENSKYIISSALEHGMNPESIFFYSDIHEISFKLKDIIFKDDAILIKASNGMQFYKIVEMIK